MTNSLGPLPAVEIPNIRVVFDVVFLNDASLIGETELVNAASQADALMQFWKKFQAWRYDQPVKSVVVRRFERLAGTFPA